MGDDDKPKSFTGRCACGDVAYQVDGPLRPVLACHCDMCRRMTGSFVTATSAWRDGFRLTREDGLRWYQSSRRARRGFCGNCGSSLFWDSPERPTISIMAGSLDKPTGLELVRHIYVANHGDYYEIADGLPHYDDHGPALDMPEG